MLIFTIPDQILKLNEFIPENRKFITFFELVPHRSNFLSRNDSSVEWSAKGLNAQWRLVNVYRYLYLSSIHSLSARWVLTRFGRGRKTPCWVSFSRFIVWNVKSDKRYRQPASSRNALSRKWSWSRESFLLDATLASHSDLRHNFDHFIRPFHANLLSYRRVITYFDWSVNTIIEDFLFTKESRTL